jgi:transposase-like protein
MSRKLDVAEVAGRPYWRQTDAQRILAAWRQSGETVSEFARRHGVDPKRLSRWASRLRRSVPAPVHFHRVQVAGDGASRQEGASIEIELRAGRRVRVAPGFGAEDLRRVLAVLDEGPTC